MSYALTAHLEAARRWYHVSSGTYDARMGDAELDAALAALTTERQAREQTRHDLDETEACRMAAVRENTQLRNENDQLQACVSGMANMGDYTAVLKRA